MRLPVGDGAIDRCDMRIGRYCYWRGDDEDDVDDDAPPPEAPAIRERRDALIRTLDISSRALSGDAWIAGQYVRYLVEAERFDDALRYARTTCAAGQSWCAALAGYAAHRGGLFAVADSAYSSALHAMSDAERCRWLDMRDLFDDELANRFAQLDCAHRIVFATRVLRLGAPLYAVSATDLLTEHLSRVVRAHIAERAATPDGEAWADDEREVMLRYGWPRWYSRTQPDFGSQIRPSITGHDAGRAYDFLPTLPVVDHLGSAGPQDWHLDDPRATTGYAPAYAHTIHELPHQIARFRRGDSIIVAAAWDARQDTTMLGHSIDAALVVVGADATSAAIARRTTSEPRGRIAVAAPIDSGLVSLELLAPQDRRAARARLGIPPRTTGRVSISDLLLYSWTPGPPATLTRVCDSMLATDAVPLTRPLGVYWETYGLRSPGAPVQFAVTVEETDVGWIRRAAERLRLADPSRGLRIQWEEVPQQIEGIAARGIRIDLSRLRHGRYTLQVSATAPGEPTVVSTRQIEVP